MMRDRSVFSFKELAVPLAKASAPHTPSQRPTLHSSPALERREMRGCPKASRALRVLILDSATQAIWLGKERSRLAKPLLISVRSCLILGKSQNVSRSELEATTEVTEWPTPPFSDKEIGTQGDSLSQC